MLEIEAVDPWDRVGRWSARSRNEAVLAWLQRTAPGKRVLEIRTGMGVWACVAARLGATRVVAVEPTELAAEARALVKRNGLDKVVTVVEGTVERVQESGFDVLLGAGLVPNPFYGGFLEEMEVAARLLAPGGVIGPARLRVEAALVAAEAPILELETGCDEVRIAARTWNLDLDPLVDALQSGRIYRWFTSSEDPVAPASVVWDLALGTGDRPKPCNLELSPASMPATGALVRTIATFEGGGTFADEVFRPMVCAWPARVPSGHAPKVRASVVEGQIAIDRRR